MEEKKAAFSLEDNDEYDDYMEDEIIPVEDVIKKEEPTQKVLAVQEPLVTVADIKSIGTEKNSPIKESKIFPNAPK